MRTFTKRRTLANTLLTSPAIAPAADAPAAAQYLPRTAHLADILETVPVGPGTLSAPRLVGAGLDAGTQSSEGRAAASNALAELEAVRQPFALVHTSITGSKQSLEDPVLREMVDAELLEALRSSADTELAGQLSAVAPLHTVAGSFDMIPALVEALFAFGKRWGAPRAILIDHGVLETNAAALIAAGSVVEFGADVLRIGGVPVIGANLAAPAEAIITRAAILVREAEAITSSNLHADNFTEGKVTVKATTRIAGVGPSLRVAV